MEINRVIHTTKFVSGFFVEVAKKFFAFVHQQADGSRTLQKDSPELSQTARAVTVTSVRPMDVDAFEVDHFRCLGEDVGFKDESSAFTPNPDTSLINSAR